MTYPLLQSDPGERQSLIRSSSSKAGLDQNGERWSRRRSVYRTSCSFAVFTVFGSLFLLMMMRPWDSKSSSSGSYDQMVPGKVTSAKIHAPTNKPGFPSFLSFANKGKIDVSYDSRSLLINGERAFFLGGSMHPARATQLTWNLALDEAVQNGLNLITVYVMWADHQPFPDQHIDWTFEQSISCNSLDYPTQRCDWSLATAIRSAADRGLFVHLRIGPYACAEYSYGGIPPWLPLHKPGMRLRRPNREWLEAMESWVAQTVEYIRNNKLWAYQGGNILMAQIENELAGNDAGRTNEVIPRPADDDNMLFVNAFTGDFVDTHVPHNVTIRKASIQDYADWCGRLIQKYEPRVTWTMCNGLTANNTIHTCNSKDTVAEFLESFGGNGRIQVDQPPILTEFEEGFQDWGETPEKPSDYFYGRTARDSLRHALKWFARGGTHLNYYMFLGGYNRNEQAAGGITNFYATDAALCPSGQRHQPKFSHYSSLHDILAGIAPTLLAAPTALGKSKKVKILDTNGNWIDGTKQRFFEYDVESLMQLDPQMMLREPSRYKHVVFIENDADEQVDVQLPFKQRDLETESQFTLAPASVLLLVDGILEFDSATIDPQFKAFRRDFVEGSSLLDWSSWPEKIGASRDEQMTQIGESPTEQTRLNVESSVSSQYSWYQTTIDVDKPIQNAHILIESQRSNGLVLYVDEVYVGDVEDHSHLYEGNYTMTAYIGDLSTGVHKLSILSESFGYSNLIGRFGNSKTGPKLKGITGDVSLCNGDGSSSNVSLVDGREWLSFPGLHSENDREALYKKNQNSVNPTWFSTIFDSPTYDATRQALFLKINTGRGHAWLNGKDLGRFWNITRGDTSQLSQEYYFLPADYLRTDGALNTIVIFDVFGGGDHPASTRLVLSSIVSSDTPNFQDEVSYPFACI